MAQKLLLLAALCFLCVNQSDSHKSGWWNPLQWREYWKLWVKDGNQAAQEGQSGELLSSPEGPNVCTLKLPAGRTRVCRKVNGEIRLQCRTEHLYTYEYRCCPGFATREGEVGCPQELYTSPKNIADVARTLGLTQFVKFLNLSGLESELSVDNSRFTLFVPNNEAFLALTEETVADLLKDRQKLQKLLLFHVAPGKLVSEGFRDNQLIKTLNSPNRLRINVGGDEITVQGALVTAHNQGARNGVLHVINKVLFPPSGNIKQVLKADARLSVFSKMLRNSNLSVTNVTVFAPTDDAFDAVPRDRLDRLLGNGKCLERFLKNHIMKKPMYASVLAGHRLPTLEGGFCDFRVKTDNSLLVNDANITKTDVTATDGVVHVIDRVLMPVSAMDLIEASQILNLTRLVDLIRKTDLAITLQDDGPFTLFAPTDDAFDNLPEAEKRALQENPARLREILQYHVTEGNQWTYMFAPDKLVPSLDGKNKLHLNSYRFGKVYSVDSACIVRANVETCNGVIHVIRKILLPPKKTIYDVISSDPRFSTLLKLVNKTSFKEKLQNRNTSLTLFAPTDAAFDKVLDRSALESLSDFPDELANVLKDHLVSKTLYTCGIHCKYSYWSLFSNRFSVFTLSRGVLRLHYRWNGHVFVNGIRLSEPDVSATNGVIHVIESVLQLDQLGVRRKARQ